VAERGGWFGMLKESGGNFLRDDGTSLAAALSYYTVLSIPPLLMLILLLAGFVWDPQDVQSALEGQFAGLMGAGAADQVQTIFEQAQQPDLGRPLAAIIGLGALAFGAIGAFVQLQMALNRVWEVRPDPDAGIKGFVGKRLLSFGMVLVIVFLLLVSLAVSALLAAFGGFLEGMLPDFLSGVLLQVINLAITLAVISLLIAAMFRFLPDAEVAWRDVWIGAIVTTVLFVAGKFLIGLYLGRSDPGDAFGAAGSLVLLLIWIYYSSIILLLGAEFTQSYARHRGSGIRPEPGAVRVVQTLEREPPAPGEERPGKVGRD
jgi:membrane protein